MVVRNADAGRRGRACVIGVDAKLNSRIGVAVKFDVKCLLFLLLLVFVLVIFRALAAVVVVELDAAVLEVLECFEVLFVIVVVLVVVVVAALAPGFASRAESVVTVKPEGARLNV